MQQTQNPQGSNRGQIIAIIVVIVLAAAVLLPRIFNNTSTPTSTVPSVPQQSNPSSDTANIQIGNPVSASGIDGNGCSAGTTSSFSTNQKIYVVAPNSNIPQGTTVYARLLRNNAPVEDTSEITADKDYVNNCINFVFEPTGAPFATGNYEAQFFINGNQGPSVQFNVQ